MGECQSAGDRDSTIGRYSLNGKQSRANLHYLLTRATMEGKPTIHEIPWDWRVRIGQQALEMEGRYLKSSRFANTACVLEVEATLAKRSN